MKSNSTCGSHCWRGISENVDAITEDQWSEWALHLEQCPACRGRLERESLQEPWWEDAKSSWLESPLPTPSGDESTWVTIEVGSGLPADTPIECERIKLHFLTPSSQPDLLGRLGRYEVERVVGSGGMGIVMKAYDTELHRIVALKVLAEHLASNASARRRFAREAQAAAAVIHPNVIPIYNVETEGELPYLVMQYVQGHSLQTKVDRDGPLPIEEALRIAKQTAAGLAAAHDQGLVHRDVKPANILLEENVDRVLLSDFGLARTVDDASLTRTGVVAGTPHYMSPEQARGESIQCVSDQFSLGAVLYYMLIGRSPFRAENAMGVLNRICHDTHRNLHELRPELPRELVYAVDRLLEKDPKHRYSDAHEVAQEMDRLLVALRSGQLRLGTRWTDWFHRGPGVSPGRRKNASKSSLRGWRSVGLLLLLVSAIALAASPLWSRRTASQPLSTPTSSEISTSTEAAPVLGPNIQEAHREVAADDQSMERWDVEQRELSNRVQSMEANWRGALPIPPSEDPFDRDVQRLQEMLDQAM